MNIDAKLVGEALAYSVAAGYAFFNIYKNISKLIKGVGTKPEATPKSKETGIIVNVDSSSNSPSHPIGQHIDHIEDDPKQPYHIIILLLKQALLSEQVNTHKSRVLHEQMAFFRKSMRPIKIRYTEIVCEILNEAGIDSICFSTYFTNSENFIDVCGIHIEATYRQMCKINHFTTKSNSEFKNTVDTNIIIIDGILNELLMKRYPQRQLLKDISKFDKLRVQLQTTLRESFEFGKQIAKEKETELLQAKKEFEEIVFTITKEEYIIKI